MLFQLAHSHIYGPLPSKSKIKVTIRALPHYVLQSLNKGHLFRLTPRTRQLLPPDYQSKALYLNTICTQTFSEITRNFGASICVYLSMPANLPDQPQLSTNPYCNTCNFCLFASALVQIMLKVWLHHLILNLLLLDLFTLTL